MIPRPRRQPWVFVFLVALGCAVSSAEGPAWPDSLSPGHEAQARKVEHNYFRYVADRAKAIGADKAIDALRDTAAAQRRSVVTEVRYEGSPGTSEGRPPEFILVVRFEYATGLTWRTTINLANDEVVKFEATLWPTPLALEEIETARWIAGPKRPDFISEPRPTLIAQVAIETPSSSLYGHRIAVLGRDGPGPRGLVRVDLSTLEVLN